MDPAETVWRVPEPGSSFDLRVDEETDIRVRRHGNPNGPRLVLCHGNGLAIDLYYPFWSLLTDEFDVVVHDLRNHGQNALGPLVNHTLPTLAADHDLVIEAIGAEWGPKPTVGVYHSVSSLAALLAPSSGSNLDALVLFDPPLRRPGVLHEEFDDAAIDQARRARGRSNRFRSKENFADLMGFSPTFHDVVDGVAHLAAETTLRDAPDGRGYELRCPPEYEGQIIEYARMFAVLVDLPSVQCPVKVIGADPTLPYSYLPTFDLGDMVGVDYDFLPDATHMLQLQQPSECANVMRDFLDSLALLRS
ncbi:MAG: alpha/beta hydrolase [Chloroflexi bacterium]|nr:alpha/beta hydrolase [Chloroflexota bacterium]